MVYTRAYEKNPGTISQPALVRLPPTSDVKYSATRDAHRSAIELPLPNRELDFMG